MITLDELNASLHSVKISDGTNDLLIDASGHISINDGGNSITIDNADITTIAGAISGTEMQVDVVASLPAGTNIIGKVYVSDGTDDLAINSDGSINALVNQNALDSWQTSTATATTTAAQLMATPLASRLKVIIQNLGTQDVYLGEDNTVTSSSGIKLPKGSSLEFPYGPSATIYAITHSGTASLRMAEYAD